jgi:diacylglycerol kinase (ATP)
MSRRVAGIANPASGRGRGSRVWPDIERAFRSVGVTDFRQTAGPGDVQRLAERALADGADTLVACGGDGTWSNVANVILRSGAPARLALVAAGTGCDFAKTVGAPATDYRATARLAVDGPDAQIDVGAVDDRFFLNIFGLGFDIAVLDDVATITWLKGDLLYFYSALRQIVGYRGISIDIASPARHRGSQRLLMLIIANARHFGGTFRIAPQAELVDGQLDAIAILDAPTLRRLKIFAAATRGTHVALPDVVVESAPSFSLTCPAPLAYELDGEYVRGTSARIEVRCVPRALRVVTPAFAGGATPS